MSQGYTNGFPVDNDPSLSANSTVLVPSQYAVKAYVGAIAGFSLPLPVNQGGTGNTNAVDAFNALSPLSALGDLLYNNGTNDVRLVGNTTTAKLFLTQTGTGTVSAAPAWGALVNGDIPAALSGKTYDGLTLTAAATGWTIAGGTTSKTLTLSNTLTLAGTDGSTLNISTGGTLGSAAFTSSTAYEPTITTLAVNKGGTGQTTYTDGQLLIGNTTGNTLAKATLTQGTGVTITNGAGAITIANSDLGSSQNIFKNVAVSGQNTIVADSNNDTLTVAAGTAITLTTNDTTDTLTITNAGVTSFSAGTTGFTPNTGTTGAVTLAGTLAIANGGTGVSTLTGIVKGNGTSAFSAASAGTDYVAPGAVTTSGLTQATARILGRTTASTGAVEEISIGTGLSLATGSLSCTVSGVSDGDKGDITVSSSGATWTIDNTVVTYAKIQNVSATSRILGRRTAAAGSVEECTLTQVLDMVGSAAQGDILYRDASAWARLGAGTSGQYLKTQGASANPTWADVAAGGFTVAAGVTLSGASSISLTGIPAGTKVIQIAAVDAVHATTTAYVNIRIGDSGGIETTGYVSSASAGAAAQTATDRFRCGAQTGNGDTTNTIATLVLINSSTNLWAVFGLTLPQTGGTGNEQGFFNGYKSLSATLDRVALVTSSGNWTSGTLYVTYSS